MNTTCTRRNQRLGYWILGMGALLSAGQIQTAHAGGSNPLFGYTHLMPSPYTLPAGRLVFGTDVALGVTDFLQVGTNVIRDIYQVYNVNAKISLIDYPVFAMGLTGGWETFNYRDIDPRNPNIQQTTWLPGMVMAFELLPRVALFTGGNVSVTEVDASTDGIETSGYFRGSSVQADLSWAYNPPSKKKGVGNVLSGGVSYDVTYKLLGVGVSHHWSGFHLGIHYYPNADRYRVQPILSGGGAIDL